jgi:mRNA interferase MazF
MIAGTSIKQREIVLMPFPYSDLSQSKKRPALVVSSDEFNESSPDVICCSITSNPARERRTVEITNRDMESGFLEFESKIKPYHLFTVSKQRIYQSLGILRKTKFNDVISLLHTVTPKTQ